MLPVSSATGPDRELAAVVADACRAEGVPHMFTGALATGLYGSPRSTADVDVVVDVADSTAMPRLVTRLAAIAVFDTQVQFDTLTFGSRRIGKPQGLPPSCPKREIRPPCSDDRRYYS